MSDTMQRPPKSRLVSWIALGAGAYIAFTVARFPAETAYGWFAPDALRLSGISGTAWSGSAALASVPGLPLRDLRWDVSAPALLTGRIAGAVEARLADGFVRTRVTATPSTVTFENLQASTRLRTLRALLPVRDSEAAISVDLGRFVVADGWPVDAAGELRIGELAVPPFFPTGDGRLIELGSYRIDFTGSGGNGIVATFTDTGGPLEVAGDLSLGLDRRYELDGLLRVRPGAPEELVRGVDIITGEPNADGQRPFSFPGSL